MPTLSAKVPEGPTAELGTLMSKRKRALAMLAGGGRGQADAASLFAAPPRQRDGSHLQVDAPALVERKSRNPRLTIAAESGGRCTAPRRLR